MICTFTIGTRPAAWCVWPLLGQHRQLLAEAVSPCGGDPASGKTAESIRISPDVGAVRVVSHTVHDEYMMMHICDV
jgi:hemolysin-activating ACP:hemolysin acyltransferase